MFPSPQANGVCGILTYQQTGSQPTCPVLGDPNEVGSDPSPCSGPKSLCCLLQDFGVGRGLTVVAPVFPDLLWSLRSVLLWAPHSVFLDSPPSAFPPPPAAAKLRSHPASSCVAHFPWSIRSQCLLLPTLPSGVPWTQCPHLFRGAVSLLLSALLFAQDSEWLLLNHGPPIALPLHHPRHRWSADAGHF